MTAVFPSINCPNLNSKPRQRREKTLKEEFNKTNRARKTPGRNKTMNKTIGKREILRLHIIQTNRDISMNKTIYELRAIGQEKRNRNDETHVRKQVSNTHTELPQFTLYLLQLVIGSLSESWLVEVTLQLFHSFIQFCCKFSTNFYVVFQKTLFNNNNREFSFFF